MKKWFIMLMMFAGLSGSRAQEVESEAYDLMLKGLLDHSVPEIGVAKASKVARTGKVVFLDAREKKEYEVSHIRNSRWVGYDDFSFKRLDDLPKDQAIIVYCSVGKRSENITEKLREKGYENAANLYGGIFEWVNSGNPVYKEEQMTDSVHAYSKTWGIWLKKGEKIYD